MKQFDVIRNCIVITYISGGPTTPSMNYISQQDDGIKLSDTKLVVIMGTTFSVKCLESTGVPMPSSYRWSGKLNSNTHTISFANIATEHSGNYTCYVENTMVRTVGETETGRNSKTIYVEVHCKYKTKYKLQISE